MRRFWWLAMASWFAACGGGTSPLTQIVVLVDSDLSVPSELDALSIEVVTGTASPVTASVQLRVQPLPGSVGLVHSSGPLGPVKILVRGLLNGSPVVERLAVVSFEPDKTLLLRMPLSRACLNTGMTACGAELTCDLGQCVKPEVATLPVWDHQVRPFDVGSAGADHRDGGSGGGSAGTSAPIAGTGTGGMRAAGNAAAGDSAAGSGGTSGAGGNDAGINDSGPQDAQPQNFPPTCTISQPSSGATFLQGDAVMLAGACTDPESGPLSVGLRWRSDRDGMLGTTAGLTLSNLSLGAHTISLCTSDPMDANLEGCASLDITVTPLPAITATISAVNQSSNNTGIFYSNSGSIVATASSTGVDPITLVWSDSVVGAVSGTTSATLAPSLIGKHRLTLTATDARMRTATDSRIIWVIPSTQPRLIAPFTAVNSALGSGRVDVLAADAMYAYAAENQPQVLYRFAASDPNSTPAATVTTTPNAIRDVWLHAPAGVAYLATAAGFQTCGYAVSSGIDSSACTTHQGGSLPSDSITKLLRVSVGSSDYLLVGTSQGLFVPDSAALPDAGGSTHASAAISGLAASTQSLWVSALDSLSVVDLTATSPFAGSAHWQTVDLGGSASGLTGVALGTADSVWVTGASGLARWTPSTSTWTTWRASTLANSAPSLASNDTRSVAVARPTIAGVARDVIWIATAAGVSRFDTLLGSFTTFTTYEGLPSNSVRTILVLPNGDRLFGTDTGVALYKGL